MFININVGILASRHFFFSCLLGRMSLIGVRAAPAETQSSESLVSKFVEQLALKKLRLDSTFFFLHEGKPLYSTLYYI